MDERLEGFKQAIYHTAKNIRRPFTFARAKLLESNPDMEWSRENGEIAVGEFMVGLFEETRDYLLAPVSLAKRAHERYGIKGVLGVGAGVGLEITALSKLPALNGDIKDAAFLGALIWMLGHGLVRQYNLEQQNPQPTS